MTHDASPTATHGFPAISTSAPVGYEPFRRSDAPPAASGPSSSSTPPAPHGPLTQRTPLVAPSPFPTPAALALTRATWRELEQAFQRGTPPDRGALAGWEFRGINWTPPGAKPLAQLAGIKKFVKGFFHAGDGRVMGYNCPVVQNVLDGRWRTRPSESAPRRFGFYEVAPVDATARDNHYLHALLLDYGKGGNAAWDPTRGLRDYLVQVDAGDPDLFLGKAYYAVGPARVAAGFFVLERFRRGPTDVAR